MQAEPGRVEPVFECDDFADTGSLAAPHCLADASATRRQRSGALMATDVLTVVLSVRRG